MLIVLVQVEAGVCTDASAEKVIQNAIMSQVFEVLPQHLPYKVGLEIQEILQCKDQLVVVAVLSVSEFFNTIYQGETEA